MTLKDEYTEAEIKHIIRREERHIQAVKNRMIDNRYDILDTRRVIAFWKTKLKKVQQQAKSKKAK